MHTNDPAGAGPVDQLVRPAAWMAKHGGQPVQATVIQLQADEWAQAGGEVEPLYDGQTLWNSCARAAKVERARWEALRAAATDAVRVWQSPSWNWSHSGSAADAINALAACLQD